jgi:hypothetical protein
VPRRYSRCSQPVANARAYGTQKMPLAPAAATQLRIRISWRVSDASIWEQPAHQVRVTLSD